MLLQLKKKYKQIQNNNSREDDQHDRKKLEYTVFSVHSNEVNLSRKFGLQTSPLEKEGS